MGEYHQSNSYVCVDSATDFFGLGQVLISYQELEQ